jgi:two-component system nitrogen regulation response regulator NtrX
VLRALQENLINRVGSDKDIKVDVRVLAATNKDLKKEIEAGRFREDLYHRLSVILIQVPALKDRKEDIPLLVDKFLEDIAQESGDAKKRIAMEAMDKLQEFPWTGNIRELRNVVERLVILGESTISLEDIKKYADY